MQSVTKAKCSLEQTPNIRCTYASRPHTWLKGHTRRGSSSRTVAHARKHPSGDTDIPALALSAAFAASCLLATPVQAVAAIEPRSQVQDSSMQLQLQAGAVISKQQQSGQIGGGASAAWHKALHSADRQAPPTTVLSAAAFDSHQQNGHQHLQLMTKPLPANNRSNSTLLNLPSSNPDSIQSSNLLYRGSSNGPGGLPLIYSSLPPIPTTFPDLPNLKQPQIYQEVLPNGLKVFLLEDKEVPLTRGTILMEGGQAASPDDKVGLASVAASIQRSGGSKAHPADVIDDRLEDLAAAIEASAGQQATTIDFQCMSQHTPEILQLLYEMLTQPALPQDKLDVVKAQARNAIEHRDDNASSVARRELYKLLYGQDSIYARTSSLSGIASITPADMAGFIASWQRPDSAILGLVGDFDTRSMMQTIKQVLGPWSPAAGQPPKPLNRPQETMQDLPEVLAASQGQQQQQQRRVYLIDRPKAGQSSVFVGEPGLTLSDPDVYSLDVLSSRLNGFGGLLFDELRTREGLAYSVSAGWDTPVDHKGLFVAAAETGQPARFIQGLSRVLSSTLETPLTPEELSKSKAGLLNSFVFNFASTYSQLQRTMVYQLLGLPQDFLFRYRDRVEAVTADQVVAAAKRHLHPDQQLVVVVGDAAVVAPQLKEAGFEVQPLKPVPAN